MDPPSRAFHFHLLALVGALVAIAPASPAATIPINVTVAVSDGLISPFMTGEDYRFCCVALPAVSVSQGDLVVLTITFDASQRIQIADPVPGDFFGGSEVANVIVNTTPNTVGTFDGTITFLDVSGDLLLNPLSDPGRNEPNLVATDSANLTNTAFSFGGLRAEFDITSLSGSWTPFSARFGFRGDVITVIPEPGTVFLVAFGVAVLALRGSRRGRSA